MTQHWDFQSWGPKTQIQSPWPHTMKANVKPPDLYLTLGNFQSCFLFLHFAPKSGGVSPSLCSHLLLSSEVFGPHLSKASTLETSFSHELTQNGPLLRCTAGSSSAVIRLVQIRLVCRPVTGTSAVMLSCTAGTPWWSSEALTRVALVENILFTWDLVLVLNKLRPFELG